MLENQESSTDFRSMIKDYMNNGYLENIVALFKQEDIKPFAFSLYELIPEMLIDERIRVRVGVATLVEELMAWQPEKLFHLIPVIGNMLNSENPTLRGDAASILQTLSHKEALTYLQKHVDENFQVKEIIKDAIEELESNSLFS